MSARELGHSELCCPLAFSSVLMREESAKLITEPLLRYKVNSSPPIVITTDRVVGYMDVPFAAVTNCST
jgi:hypothetical protein